MNKPTPEQIQQWARAAIAYASIKTSDVRLWEDYCDERLVTLACAWQAEQDVSIVENTPFSNWFKDDVTEAIRANAPKVTP